MYDSIECFVVETERGGAKESNQRIQTERHVYINLFMDGLI